MPAQGLLSEGQQSRVVLPSSHGVKCCASEVRHVADALANAGELPVEECWSHRRPEEVAEMTIVMHERAWTRCQDAHGVATPARITPGKGGRSVGTALRARRKPRCISGTASAAQGQPTSDRFDRC